MSEKIYLNLFIFCCILFQRIIGNFLEDDHKNSSNLHIRKKRLVDYTLGGAKTYSITQFPYIVQVLQKGNKICAGMILSPDYILTAKVCADETKEDYSVESGGLYMSKIINHPVVGIYIEGHLALLVIRPVIDFVLPSLNRNILLFEGPLPPYTLATIIGWGPIRKLNAPNSTRDIKSYSFRRAIDVPVMDINQCNEEYSKKYPHHFVLTNDNICTHDTTGKRGCTDEDAGSALVMDGKLVGVLIFPGRIVSPDIPDVFIRVNDNEYHKWIISHIGPYVRYLENQVNTQHPQNQHPQSQHPQNQHPHSSTSHYPSLSSGGH